MLHSDESFGTPDLTRWTCYLSFFQSAFLFFSGNLKLLFCVYVQDISFKGLPPQSLATFYDVADITNTAVVSYELSKIIFLSPL